MMTKTYTNSEAKRMVRLLTDPHYLTTPQPLLP